MSNFIENIDVLKDNIPLVRSIIDEELTTDSNEFNTTVKRFFNDRAKLIRPSLTLIASNYKNKIGKNELLCAAAMEILHVATLIHDDIIDESFSRRGVETINKTHSVGYALICGDYLLSKSYEMLFKTKNFGALEYIGGNTVDMCFGEVSQYHNRQKSDINREVYLDIIDKKTGALFQSNLIVGANLTNMKKDQKDNLIEFGKYFGRIFQIIDDIKDFTMTEKESGKPVFNDISKGIYSLPIIIARELDDSIDEDLDNNNSEEVIRKVLDSDAIKLSKEYYKTMGDMAYKSLEGCDESIAKDLTQILEYVLNA